MSLTVWNSFFITKKTQEKQDLRTFSGSLLKPEMVAHQKKGSQLPPNAYILSLCFLF